MQAVIGCLDERPRRSRWVHAGPMATAVGLVLLLTACTGDAPDTTGFCATAVANKDRLVGNIIDNAERAATITRFEALRAQAPAIIEDDLGTMLTVFDALGKLDVADPDDRNQAIALAASEPLRQASTNVETYVLDTCGVSLTPQTGEGSSTTSPATTASSATDATSG